LQLDANELLHGSNIPSIFQVCICVFLF
jgi:hypothetical protein